RPPRPTLFPYTTLFRSEVRAGMDLQELVREAKAFKALVDRLAARAPAFAIEQGALAGLFNDAAGELADRAARAAERLNLYAEERSEEHTSELQSRENLV